jgi:hypothetical protein
MDRESLILKLLGMLLGEEQATVATAAHPRVGQWCIVRASAAGVWFGRVEAVRPEYAEVDLSSARRLWSWHSDFSLSELALTGPIGDRNRYASPLPGQTIAGYCEITPVSDVARAAIMGVPHAGKA